MLNNNDLRTEQRDVENEAAQALSERERKKRKRQEQRQKEDARFAQKRRMVQNIAGHDRDIKKW